MPNFFEICQKSDVVGIKVIGGFCYKHDQNNDKVFAVMNSLRALFINFQKSEVKEFQAKVVMLDDYGANILDLIPCLP